ncbi:MAG: hypothetical protein ACW98X_12110 [Promethearchaeota archaeon]|jgi:hypothetical protein
MSGSTSNTKNTNPANIVDHESVEPAKRVSNEMPDDTTDPVKTDPAKTDPAKTDPVKTDPAKTDNVISTEFVNIIKNVFGKEEEWYRAIYAGMLFFIISSPCLYGCTNKFATMVGFQTTENGIPTLAGIMLHTMVFVICIKIIMYIDLPGVVN